MNIYLMRHGETIWNKEGLIQGSSDVDLTEYGVDLAHVTAQGLAADGIQFSRIYSSPLIRAVKTAQIIAEKCLAEHADKNTDSTTPPLYIDQRVREMGFGTYEGKNLQEIAKWDSNIAACFSRPSAYVPDPTAERFADVYDRVADFLNRELLPLEEAKKEENVLVVCHGAVIRVFLTYIRRMDLDEFWTIRQPNCSLNLISLENGVFSSVRENILYYDASEMLKRGIL